MQTIFVESRVRDDNKRTRLKNSIKLRKRGGAYYCALKKSLKNFFKSKDGNNFDILTESAMRYFFGINKSQRYFSKHIDSEQATANPPDTLYHFLPIEYLETVRTQGLKTQRGLIYLTDDVQYIIEDGYLQYKTDIRGKDTEFCILEINAALLKSESTIYSSRTEHEYIVKSVDKKFIRQT